MSWAKDSLRWQLVWRIGVALIFLWVLLAPWLLLCVQKGMQRTLDDRLTASAQMVMSLMTQYDLDPLLSQPPNLLLDDDASSFPLTQACRIANVKGDIIALSHDAPEVLLGEQPREGFQNKNHDGERWRVYTLSQSGLTISTAERLHTREVLMHSVAIAASVPFVLSLVGTLTLLWFGIAHQLKPLQTLSQHVSRRNSQDLTPLQWEQRPSEVKPLVNEINRLLERINQSIQRERRFTGDVAHELRTPLAGIKTHIQVARLTEGDKSEHALMQAEKGTDRLQRTLDQLLLLARVEGDDSLNATSQLKIAEINHLAFSDVNHLADRYQVALQCDNQVPEAIRLPAILLSAAIRNILENAIRHSAAGDKVLLKSSFQHDKVVWEISDQGPGVSNDILTTLTERFVHGNQSQGSGLGLAIVDAIVRQFSGYMQIENLAGAGLKVTLHVPLR